MTERDANVTIVTLIGVVNRLREVAGMTETEFRLLVGSKLDETILAWEKRGNRVR